MKNITASIKKTRGIIDPFTLGILISLIGSTIVLVAHKDDNELASVSDSTFTETVTVTSDDSQLLINSIYE